MEALSIPSKRPILREVSQAPSYPFFIHHCQILTALHLGQFFELVLYLFAFFGLIFLDVSYTVTMVSEEGKSILLRGL